MAEVTDYQVLQDEGTFSGHGERHVNFQSFHGPSIQHSSTDKGSPPLTPLPSDLNDEALITLSNVDGDGVVPEPQGKPKALPSIFLGSGYGRNSYFTWRLRLSSLFVAALSFVGIMVFWTADHASLHVQDIGRALSFKQNYSNDCKGRAYCGACDTVVVYAMLVYHIGPLLVLIGLPASGFRIFDPFYRNQGGRGRQKIQRSVFFQFCESLSVVVLVFSLIVVLYFMYAIFQGNNISCHIGQSIVYVVVGAVTFVANIVVLTYFARFRQHLSMQLGAYKETDQICSIRSHFKHRQTQSERKRVINGLRKALYMETSLGNVAKLETLLVYAKEHLGTDFALEMYGDARLVFNLFGRSKKNPIHVAAYLGNVQALQLLLDAAFRVDSYDKVSRVRFTTGDLFWAFARFFVSMPSKPENEMTASIFRTTLVTPLYCAVRRGQIQAVQWLIEHGANVNLRSKSSYWSDRIPPLFAADNVDIVAKLLEAGANYLEVPDPGHMNTLTALQIAYMRGNSSVAHKLEEWGADVALTPLHEAAAKNSTLTMEKLLKMGADPNCVGEYGYVGMHRRTPLHWAAINNAVDAVQVLLGAGSDPNFQDIFGRSPLHWAANVNKLEAVRVLLSNGADVNLRDYRDCTPLLCAASSKNVSADLFECLVQYGADIDDCLPNGDTALHIAMKFEQKGTALALVGAGADVMKTNDDGYRPVDCTTSTHLQYEIKQAAGDRDVMISYTHSHSEFALKIRDSFERANITSWLDLMSPSGIGGGSVWREEIARGIKNAEVIICLYTEDYPLSQWCLKELALAKQLQKPIIAVSAEGAIVTDEMQVYIYTRQIVPFEPAIKRIIHANRREISYEYDEEVYAAQFCLLLDGVRDEIKKQREANIASGSNRQFADGISELSGNVAEWDSATLDNEAFAFLSHGDYHPAFVKRLHNRLNDNHVRCFIEGTQLYLDMAKRIDAAKEAILKCEVFIVILSAKTVYSELVKDQLAFAEDKGKPILPVMLNDVTFPLDKHYTLSRMEILHFTPELGFNSSFMRLLDRVRENMPKPKASFNALRVQRVRHFDPLHE